MSNPCSYPSHTQLGEIGCLENSTYYLQMSANTHKGANGITLQKDYESFLAFFTFSYERILNEIFCNLLLRIHTVAPLDHMVCVNQC